MKKLFSFCLLIVFLLASCGGGGSGGSSSESENHVGVKNGWLVLIYMDGDNSLSGATAEDLREIESVKYSPQVKVVVLRDTFGNEGGTIYDYNYENSSFDEFSVPEPNMGEPSTLVNFVEKYARKYPYSNVALIMWNHGDAWRGVSHPDKFRAAAEDVTDDDYLYMHELKEALQKLSDDGIRINLIGFDECLMGNLEVFYDIKDYTDVVVASEVSEPYEGWNYSYVMKEVSNNPSLDAYAFGKVIVDAYRKAYASEPGNYTMIAVKSSDVNVLVRDINQFISLLDSNYGCFYSARQNPSVTNDDLESLGTIDLGNFAYRVSECLSNSYVSDIVDRINSFYKYISPNSNLTGISIFFPSSNKVNDFDYYFADAAHPITLVDDSGEVLDENYYNPFTETEWDEFLERYFSH